MFVSVAVMRSCKNERDQVRSRYPSPCMPKSKQARFVPLFGKAAFRAISLKHDGLRTAQLTTRLREKPGPHNLQLTIHTSQLTLHFSAAKKRRSRKKVVVPDSRRCLGFRISAFSFPLSTFYFQLFFYPIPKSGDPFPCCRVCDPGVSFHWTVKLKYPMVFLLMREGHKRPFRISR